jgi:hypothetical protein
MPLHGRRVCADTIISAMFCRFASTDTSKRETFNHDFDIDDLNDDSASNNLQLVSSRDEYDHLVREVSCESHLSPLVCLPQPLARPN